MGLDLLAVILAVTLQGQLDSPGSTIGVIGVNLGMSHNVRVVHEDSPAKEVGIQVGDIIKRSIDLEGSREITGRPNTPIALIISRAGCSKPLVILVTRRAYQRINDKTVRSYFKGRERY